jgi:hypothetical protein
VCATEGWVEVSRFKLMAVIAQLVKKKAFREHEAFAARLRKRAGGKRCLFFLPDPFLYFSQPVNLRGLFTYGKEFFRSATEITGGSGGAPRMWFPCRPRAVAG